MNRAHPLSGRHRLLVLGVGALLCSLGTSFAQTAGARSTPAPRATPGQAPSDDQVFDAAAKAVASGQAEQLLARAEAALAKSPADRPAAASTIAVLLAKAEIGPALKVYEAWSKAAAREDAALLSRLAGGVLGHLERSAVAEVRAQSLEARARAGDTAARARLTARHQATPETPDTWESTMALARLGDESATANLVAAAREVTGSRRVAALGAFKGVPSSPAMIEALRSALAEGDDVVRDAAADAATGRTSPSLAGPLRQVMKTARFTAPLRAAVALMRLGDESGRPLVDAALKAPLADGRLLAARAYVGRPDTGWIASLEPLLADPNVLYRVFAAELLMPVRATAALEALSPILADENPVLRAEATRVAALAPSPPLPALRAALGDASPWVQFHAAQALMAKAPAPRGRVR